MVRRNNDQGATTDGDADSAPVAFPFGRNGRYLAFALVALVILAPFVYGFSGDGLLKPNGENIAADFGALYVAGELASEEGAAAAYDWRVVTDKFGETFGFEVGGLTWSYPPPALFPFMGLSQLPYRWAAFFWMAGGVAAFVLALRALRLPAPMMVVALVLPGVSLALASGQVSLFIAAAFGGGLALLDRRPILAGLLFGLMALKPQIAVLVPVALVFGRYWLALASSILTVIAMCLAAAVVFDFAVWSAALASLETSAKALELQAFKTFRMPSLYVYGVTLGLDAIPARVVQAASALAAAIAVGWSWARHRMMDEIERPAPAIRAAVLVAATPLVSPYVYDYDLLILVFPILWIWNAGSLSGWKYGEPWALLCAAVLFGAPATITEWLGFHPGWLVAVTLLCLGLRRVEATRRPAKTNP